MGYAKHIGRVGALAVALGIGAAVATTPGVAWATEGEDGPGVAAPSDPGTPNAPGTPTSSTPSTEHQDPGDVIRRNLERAAGDVRDGIRKAHTGVARSSGGAITSTHRGGPTPNNGNVPSVVVKDEEEPVTPEPVTTEPQTFVANVNDNSARHFAPRWRPPQAQVSTAPAPKPGIKVLDDVKDSIQQMINAVSGSQPDTGSTTVQRNTISTLDTPILDPQPVRAPFVAPIQLVTNVLNAAISPFINPTPGQPAPQNPILWAVLGWVRRQVQDSPFGKFTLNPRPDISYDASEDVQLGGAVIGFLNPHDRDLEPDHLDKLTYQVTDLDEGASLNIDGTGAFLYTPPDSWDGTTPYTDTFSVTVSDADSGPHFHGLAELFSPSGGHTDTEKVVVTVNPVTPTGPDPVTGTVPVSLGTTTNLAVVARSGDTITTSAGSLKLTVTPNGSGSYDVGGDFTPSDATRVQASQNQVATFRAVSAMRAMSLAAADSPEPVTQEVTVEIEHEPFTFEVPVLPARYKAAQSVTVGDAPFYMVTSGDRLYVLSTPGIGGSQEPATISVIDTTTNQRIGEPIALGSSVGTIPSGMVVNGNRIYISNASFGQPGVASSITVVDIDNNAVLDPIALDGSPTSIAASGDRLYVGQSQGAIAVINLDESNPDYGHPIEAETISTGALQPYIAVHGKTLYVSDPALGTANPDHGLVHVVDIDPQSLHYGENIAPDISISGGYPGPPTVSPAYDEDGHAYVWIPSGQLPGAAQPGKITVIDTKTNQVVNTVTLPSAPVNTAFSPDGSLAYVGSNDTMSVVDTGTGHVLFTTVADVSPDGFANLVAVSSDGKSVYLSDPITSLSLQQPNGTVLGNTISVVAFTTGANTAAPEIDASVPDRSTVDPGSGAVPVAVTTSDGDDDALTVFVAVQPSNGHVIIAPTGDGNYIVTYTPTEQARENASTVGPTEDTFVLTVSDAEKYQSTTVRVPITSFDEAVSV